jgi:hypothetical protein
MTSSSLAIAHLSWLFCENILWRTYFVVSSIDSLYCLGGSHLWNNSFCRSLRRSSPFFRIQRASGRSAECAPCGGIWYRSSGMSSFQTSSYRRCHYCAGSYSIMVDKSKFQGWISFARAKLINQNIYVYHEFRLHPYLSIRAGMVI